MDSQSRKSWIKDPVNDVANWLIMNPGVKNRNLDETIMEYLHYHPDLLEQFVLENVTVKKVKKWIRAKEEEYKHQIVRQEIPSPLVLTENILELIKNGETKRLLLKFSIVLQEAIKADDAQVHLTNADISEIEVSANVKIEKYKNRKIIKLRLCSSYPYQNCIITLKRLGNSLPFSLIDLDVALFLTNSLATCFFLYESTCENIRNKVLKELFPHLRALLIDSNLSRKVIIKILFKTRSLLSADRANLYIYNEKKNELMAEYFDSGHNFVTSEIKCSLNEAFCGLAANEAKLINIKDGGSNNIFLTEMKRITGIDIKNIICCPAKSDGKLFGVLQVLRGTSPSFNATDEAIVECMAIYCSLVLYLAKTHKEILIKDNKMDINREMLKYHIQPSEEEVEGLKCNPFLECQPPEIETINFPFINYTEKDIPRLFVYISRNILDNQIFPIDKLSNFILTVVHSYRNVAYHNIFHAFNVAHCLYLMIKDVKDKFSILEMKAFLIASICHDLDHRGFNNDFQIVTNSPLASLYVNSIMERHHYQMTLNILQESENDVFCDLSADERQVVLEEMKTLIIATDLALFSHNINNLQYLIENGKFDIKNDTHRKCLKKVMMNGGDVSAVCKPWHIQLAIVKDLYKELYAQGDIEKKMGLKPNLLMDRDLQDRIPEDQINFINYVCLPCYKLISNCLPHTQFILSACKKTVKSWKDVYPFQEPIRI